MSWISASDPLALLTLQTAAGTPRVERAAAGATVLDTQQVAAVLGEPVPIAFARRRNEQGGILISPKATEARFEYNEISEQVIVHYHLILSEGQMGMVERRDVRQSQCRVGTYTQTYNRRAGTWDPGNFVTATELSPKPSLPQHCGSVGRYPDMSTMSYRYVAPPNSDEWNRQVHVFVRDGMYVQRLFDNGFGASDNFCDLVYWGFLKTGKVPASLVDVDALRNSAVFLEKQGFTCNTYIQESSNLPSFIAQWARYFMLRETNTSGKKGLKPALPVNSSGEFITDTITPKYNFTDDVIIPGSMEITYTSLSDRLPFVAQVMWRQQLEGDVGIIRTSEVRFKGQAQNGPYESHDLSAVCTSELHAVRIGAYVLSRRFRSNHSVRFATKPEIHNKTISVGDIVRIGVKRETQIGVASRHDWYYQVERISKTLAGDVSYECSHFPVDIEGRSLIIQDVLAAQPTGLIISSNRTGPSCDLFSSTDRTIPEEEGRDDGALEPKIEIDTPIKPGEQGGVPGDEVTGGGGAIEEPPTDNLDELPQPMNYSPPGPIKPGTVIYLDEGCPPDEDGTGWTRRWEWYVAGITRPDITTRYIVVGTAGIAFGKELSVDEGSIVQRGGFDFYGRLVCTQICSPDPDQPCKESIKASVLSFDEIQPLASGEEVQFLSVVDLDTTFSYMAPTLAYAGGWSENPPYLRTTTREGGGKETRAYALNSEGEEVDLQKAMYHDNTVFPSITITKVRRRSNGGPWQEVDLTKGEYEL